MASSQHHLSPPPSVAFGPFLLDRRAGRLLHDRRAIDLRPKAWEVLCYLVDRPGVLVSPDELFDQVWPGVAVTPQTLMNVIAELRSILGDDARKPRFLETVRGRGYRFCGVQCALPPGEVRLAQSVPGSLLGRDHELSALAGAWEDALASRGRIVLLSGEAGIGKTALVEVFTASLAADHAAGRALVGSGHCVEHHGAGEPYMPLLSAVEGLLAGPRRKDVESLLRQCAPTWLLQLPALLREGERGSVERKVAGASALRMLREGASLFEAIARSIPTLVVLEDLHWSDASTLECASLLAKRLGSTSLLLLCTCRPLFGAAAERAAEAFVEQIHARAGTIVLELPRLDRASILSYLERRLGDAERARKLAPQVEIRSAGNPLFLRSLVDEMLDSSALPPPLSDGTEAVPSSSLPPPTPADSGEALRTPPALRVVIERYLDSLGEADRALVEAASVLGPTPEPVELSAALARPPEEVEADLLRLARSGRLLIRNAPPALPDGSRTSPCSFVHAAHRLAVYEGIPPLRRERLHRQVGEAIERSAGPQIAASATRLARHFRASGIADKALSYLRIAADVAAGRFAYHEAVALLEEALRVIHQAPHSDEMRVSEAQVHIQLGNLLALSEGYASHRARREFARAGELLDDEQGRFAERLGLEMVSAFSDMTSARWREAHERASRILAMVEHIPGLVPVACCWLAFPTSAMGDLPAARALLERGAAIEPLPGIPPHFDVRRMIESQLALVLVGLGYPREARALRDASLARSLETGTQLDIAHSALWATEAAVLAEDRPAGQRLAALSVEASERNGFPRYLAQSQLYRAWFSRRLEPDERVACMQAALAERRRFGDRYQETVALGLIARAQLEGGDRDGAAASLAEALQIAESTGERHFEPELHRLEGEILLARCDAGSPGPSRAGPQALARAAEQRFRVALDLAFQQRSRHWGRRTLGSLDALLARDPDRSRDRAALCGLARDLEELS